MDEKILLSLLEDGIRWTIEEWLRAPTEYLYEADLQALLAGKLKQLLHEKQQRTSYLHRVWGNSAWREQKPLSLIGCEHLIGGYYPDIVIWDPSSQAQSYPERRHALAVIELKCTFPKYGTYSEDEWDVSGRRDDYEKKVRSLVQNGTATWGLALVFQALPSEVEAYKFFSSKTSAFERDPLLKIARFRIMNYGPVPDFHFA